VLIEYSARQAGSPPAVSAAGQNPIVLARSSALARGHQAAGFESREAA
jgi:hypothetical protein